MQKEVSCTMCNGNPIMENEKLLRNIIRPFLCLTRTFPFISFYWEYDSDEVTVVVQLVAKKGRQASSAVLYTVLLCEGQAGSVLVVSMRAPIWSRKCKWCIHSLGTNLQDVHTRGSGLRVKSRYKVKDVTYWQKISNSIFWSTSAWQTWSMQGIIRRSSCMQALQTARIDLRFVRH